MLEEFVIRQCAPTLAGLKTGNLFSVPYTCVKQMHFDVRKLNRVIVPKGLRALPMRCNGGKALIYVYRPSCLKRDFADGLAVSLLQAMGYPCEMAERCVIHLIKKLRVCSEFPHEIGLFFGYPPEDVL